MLDVDIVIPCFECRIPVTELRSLLPNIWSLGVRCRAILVDDGSTAPNAIPDSVATDAILVLRHTTNRGRAAACNTGALACSADLIWFLDSDCVPGTASALRAHLEVIGDSDASVGPIRSLGSGFWARYQNRVADDRGEVLRHGVDVNACTSANLLIRRTTFLATGGFDERYSKYGFEDRDLFLRLVKNGAKFGFSEHAVVFHEADLDLTSICRKMLTAGRYSSGVFRGAYPAAYRCTKYGKLDVREHSYMYSAAVKVIWSALRRMLNIARPSLEVHVIPFAMRMIIARGFSAVAFAYGTLQAQKDTDANDALS